MEASGNFSRSAAMAGVVRIRSPIRLSWMRRMFIQTRARARNRYRSLENRSSAGEGARLRRKLALHPHRFLIRNEEPGAEMVPGEIVHDASPRGFAHSFDGFRMPIQLEDRRR